MDWVQVGKDFLSAFVQLFLVAVIPVLVTAAVAWIKGKFQEIKEARPDIVRELSWMMPIFVQAAEQAKVAGLIETKKDYALSLAQEWLKSKGWSLDLFLIEGLIEQAVYDTINSQKSTDGVG